MKKNLLLLFMSVVVTVTAQSPQGFSYQAALRSPDGTALSNHSATLRISLTNQSEETVYYAEIHSSTTNEQGIVSLYIGQGEPVSGDIGEIPWGTAQIYLKVELQTTGGSFLDMGTSQLMSVPYAMFAADGNQGPQGEQGPAGTQGIPGETGPAGANGISVQWLGTLDQEPANPSLNQAYYNSTEKKSYVYDGSAWQIMTQDGADAISAVTGTGTAGKIAVWSGAQQLTNLESFNIDPNVAVISNPTAGDEDPIFEVKNKLGQVVFGVYQSGVRIYVDDSNTKAEKGGFAVGGLSTGKEEGNLYFRVTPDSVRVLLREPLAKTEKGGFAVGGLSTGKEVGHDLFFINSDSARIYINTDPEKAEKGGFAVGGLSSGKNTGSNLLSVAMDSTTFATADPTKRVVIKTPTATNPLLNIDGSLKMGADNSSASGSISYDGEKFLTFEQVPGKRESTIKQFVVTGTPEVSTDSVFNITRSEVTVAGRVLVDGGSEVSARGVCFGTASSPTLANGSNVSGSGTGPFVSTLTGLMGATTYYLRAYATNSQFTSYGAEIEVTTANPVPPTISTGYVSSITTNSAVCGGDIPDDGSAFITQRGVCWNTEGNPTIDHDFTTNGTGSGTFTSTITGLEGNVTYFVRAYAMNSVGVVYGGERSFATTNLPVLSTNPITSVTGTTAVSGGNIFAGGELEILQRGVCWNNTGNPTVDDQKTQNGQGSGSFVSNITGLSLGTTFFVRAYATNATGTAYGNEYYFTTMNVPTLSTNAMSMVSGSSANCGGNITFSGGSVVTARGLCWNLTGYPTVNDAILELGEGSGTFEGSLTGLEIGTNYYVRAYAINSIGIGYGNERMFTTQNFAVVVTSEVTDITYTTAKGGGNVTSDGGANITQRGVCWNTTGTPTLDHSFTTDNQGTGEFVSTLTGLSANNVYYVRAYVINDIGTTYGQEVSFSTPTIPPPPPGLPVVGTLAITTQSDGYHTGGYVLSEGGSAVTQRGVCWSTEQNPTTAGNFTGEGSGVGLFNSVIENLAGCGEMYYVRAYAVNSTGTGYGNQLSVSSGLLPLVEITAPITDITKVSAMSGGTIASDGGCDIVERGICWSRFPNPTTNNFKTTVPGDVGSFTTELTGLFPNDTYYVRAYAINNSGTSYGPEISFTTEAGTSGLSIGQFYAGGYIFYLDETGDHGMVCMTEDLGYASWGCTGMSIPGTESGVGKGATNTAIILAHCTSPGIAAQICFDLEHNGYADWFLPSIGELELVNAHLFHGGIGNITYRWWSSTNSIPDFALAYNFDYQRIDQLPKAGASSEYVVRAVRNF